MNHLNVKKVMKVTQILDSKLLRKKSNKGMHNRSSAPSKSNVIDTAEEIESMTTTVINKHRRISRATDKL